MTATLEIVNHISVTSQGVVTALKQGKAADNTSTAYKLTVDNGISYSLVGTLATATVNTLWDEDSNFPSTFENMFFWADQPVWLQLISQANNVQIKLLKYQPFTLSTENIVAVADTTLITGGSEPTAAAMDSVVLGNYSGSTVNYVFALID